MTEKELNRLVGYYLLRGEMSLLAPASSEAVDEFQRRNDIILPVQYRMWLESISDGGELFIPGGVQLYGVANKPVIDVNDDSRPSDNYVVIGALAFGDPILFEKNSEKIAIYNQEAGRIEDDEIYDDFVAFMKDLPNIVGEES